MTLKELGSLPNSTCILSTLLLNSSIPGTHFLMHQLSSGAPVTGKACNPLLPI